MSAFARNAVRQRGKIAGGRRHCLALIRGQWVEADPEKLKATLDHWKQAEKAAANGVKREGIRIFAVNLGWVHSEGEQALQTGFHGLPENWHEEIGRRMPSGRLIVPDDVAGLLAYLVTPSAQMMTGAVIDYEQMPTGVFDAHPALAPE